MKRAVTDADLLSPEEYARQRSQLRKELVERKKNRRLAVGPFATFYFECFETIRAQIQEMLHIEKGGKEQIKDELAAYNPLIPQGEELVATLMFEIEDPVRRAQELSRLGGIEHLVFLRVGEDMIKAEAEGERTNEEGKTSAVHFLHFHFTPAQIAAFRNPATSIVIGFNHPAYGHMAMITDQVRSELETDFR